MKKGARGRKQGLGPRIRGWDLNVDLYRFLDVDLDLNLVLDADVDVDDAQ